MYLIIGASSFIGRHLYEYCKRNKIDVAGTYYSHVLDSEWFKYDLCTDNLEQICLIELKGNIPEALIICGANTSIDSCKKNEEASNWLNVTSIKRVLNDADKMGIKSVFLSSEAVFDGRKGLYTEKDSPNPITLYGSQKFQVEQYMIHNLNNYLIFRLSRVTTSKFGEKDIFDEFYNKIKNQEKIVCLKNQSFCLTNIDDVVKGIVQSIKKNVNGLYHLSSDNYISRYELARLYAQKVFGGYEGIMEKEYNNIAFKDKRHIYGGLKGEKLVKILGIRYMDMTQMLDEYVKDMNESYHL